MDCIYSNIHFDFGNFFVFSLYFLARTTPEHSVSVYVCVTR